MHLVILFVPTWAQTQPETVSVVDIVVVAVAVVVAGMRLGGRLRERERETGRGSEIERATLEFADDVNLSGQPWTTRPLKVSRVCKSFGIANANVNAIAILICFLC